MKAPSPTCIDPIPDTSQRSHPQNQQGNPLFNDLDDVQPLLPDRLTILPASLFTQRSINISSNSLREKKTELLWSYIRDWILTIVIVVACFFLQGIDGHQREFGLNDPTIQFSYIAHARVPVRVLAVLSGVLPALFIVLCSQLVLRSSWDTHTGLLGVGLSLCFSVVTTTIIKLTTGRPRPDFLARCQPLATMVNQREPFFGLRDSSVCTVSADSHILRDGFRSFPSGHASTAWAGLGFLSLYIAGKLHLWQGGHTIKLWITIFPILAAGLISITRMMDNKHHWQDIFIGSVIGFISAWCSYRFYYPALSSKSCHQPYPPRLKPSMSNVQHSSFPNTSSSLNCNTRQGAKSSNQV